MEELSKSVMGVKMLAESGRNFLRESVEKGVKVLDEYDDPNYKRKSSTRLQNDSKTSFPSRYRIKSIATDGGNQRRLSQTDSQKVLYNSDAFEGRDSDESGRRSV